MLLPRTQVTKKLIAYVKENDLQNPDDGREIFLDAALQKVLGVETCTFFGLQKHISPLLSSPDDGARKRKAKTTTTTAKNKPKTKKTKRNAGGLMKPVRISSAALVKICGGEDEMPRTEIVRNIWTYIRENNLQDPNDKRTILCDELLREVMNNEDTVTMFTMNKHISKHLLK